jgi:D-xylose 1-dehydrogenase (NADP+, D-xylono-1,5-lactone-forming)
MATGIVHWGILGPGGIAARFMRHANQAANARVVAVGSRDRGRAAEFAARFGIAGVHGSYEELLDDPAVDGVYIATPNSLHHPWTMKALAAGKHVLCEKPYSWSPGQVGEAFDAAEVAGLVLMEAFMWRHSPQARRFMELLPEVGDLQSIRATFSFRLDDARGAALLLRPELDGGSLMDVGCYCVNGARLLAGAEPTRVRAEQVLAPTGVDSAFAGLLRFASGILATISSGFTYPHASLEAIGTRASLLLLEPWQGEARTIRLGEREIPVTPDDPYRLELENISAAILGDAPPLLDRADALGQARTIEALYRSAASGAAVSLQG